jgi:hypothetical protein
VERVLSIIILERVGGESRPLLMSDDREVVEACVRMMVKRLGLQIGEDMKGVVAAFSGGGGKKS